MDYKIYPTVSKSGRRTRYAISKGSKYLSEHKLGHSLDWYTVYEIDENPFIDVGLFRTRRGAIREAERVDRRLFRQANRPKDLKNWNPLVKDYA